MQTPKSMHLKIESLGTECTPVWAMADGETSSVAWIRLGLPREMFRGRGEERRPRLGDLVGWGREGGVAWRNERLVEWGRCSLRGGGEVSADGLYGLFWGGVGGSVIVGVCDVVLWLRYSWLTGWVG